ncbi:MAG: hypothetical protein ACLVJ6_09425 [Merdibacter sp.]
MNVRLDEWSALALLERGILWRMRCPLLFVTAIPIKNGSGRGKLFYRRGGPRNSFERTRPSS